MLATALKQGVAAVVGLALAAPGGVSPVSASQASRSSGDGEATPASCGPLGFDLAARPRYPNGRPTPMPVPVRPQVYPPASANAGPPPITLPIEPTRKEDRVDYQGPPVIVPGPPPPPPPPPAPTRPAVITTDASGRVTSVDGVVVSGSRLGGASSNQAYASPPPPPPPYVAPPPATERYPDATPNPVHRVADEPVSTFSIDVDTAAYSNVRRFLADGARPPKDAVRVEELGVTDNKRLEDYVADKRETGIYLSVYGFGRGNYQDARMQTIAQSGNGTAAYVDDLNEARRLFGPQFDKGAFPIADDVKIQVEFNPGRVSEYRLIGYETRLLNEEDFANDRIDAGEVGSGASVTALYEITPVGGPSQIPDRRYEGNRPDAKPALQWGAGDPDGEVGFVQVRYKLPGQSTSKLMQHVIANPSGQGRVSTQPPEATRWAIAVAAFGQRLRNDPWMAANYDWASILDQAQGSRGDDPYGDRAEFVQIIRAAGDLPAQGQP